jgi:metallo-beta-lactamase family protein
VSTFRGSAFTSFATVDVCKILLPDAGYLQEKDAEFANRHGSPSTSRLCRYSHDRDAVDALNHLRPIALSGDLGRYNDAMVDPAPFDHADYLLVESTHGNRRHAKVDAAEASTERDRGTVARGYNCDLFATSLREEGLLCQPPWQ